MRTQGICGMLASCTLSVMSATTALAEVYKTVDENGNVVYTDQPPEPGAEPMKLRELSVVPVPEYAAKDRAIKSSGLGEGDTPDLGELRRGYRDFALTSPAPEQTFTGTGNIATIAWDTRFELQPGMQVVVQIDGKALPPTTASAITSPQLDRGEHQVSARLVDVQNRTIATSGPVTFFVHQNSALFNQGPTPRAGGG